jgi:hypothetical protein
VSAALGALSIWVNSTSSIFPIFELDMRWLWLGDKLKGLKNTSDSNLEILLNSIKEGDEVIMDFNYTMTGRRDPTYLRYHLLL